MKSTYNDEVAAILHPIRTKVKHIEFAQNGIGSIDCNIADFSSPTRYFIGIGKTAVEAATNARQIWEQYNGESSTTEVSKNTE